jgi:hypothetical protein
MGGDRLDSVRDARNVSLQLLQLYESEQFTCGCCYVQIVATFSTRTSTRPSYRVPFLISSLLKIILLLKMSSGKLISFRKSVNWVRQRLYIPYQLIPKQHNQRRLRSEVVATVFSDSPHRRTNSRNVVNKEYLCASGNIEFIRSVSTKHAGLEAQNPFNKRRLLTRCATIRPTVLWRVAATPCVCDTVAHLPVCAQRSATERPATCCTYSTLRTGVWCLQDLEYLQANLRTVCFISSW